VTPAGPGYPRRRIPALCAAAGARTTNTTACMALASSVLKRQWRRPSPAGPGLSLRPAVLCLRLYAQWQRSTVSECDGPGPGSAAAGGLGGSTQRTPTAAASGGGPARARQPESHKFLLSLSRRAQCAVASTGALQVMPVPRSVSGSNHRVTVTVAGGAPGAASHGQGLMMPGQ
jgi:hypothetical protein